MRPYFSFLSYVKSLLLVGLDMNFVVLFVTVSGMSEFVPLFRSCGHFVHCCSIFERSPIKESRQQH